MNRPCLKGGELGGRGRDSHSHSPQPGPWEDEIRRRLRPGYVVVGVGSLLRGDDAVGSIIAERLAERGLKSCFACGQAPENYLGKIAGLRPREVLFIDAADFGAAPGAIRLLDARSLGTQSISTHSAGISPLMDFLSASCHATCYVLAIQPADLTFGAALSEPVSKVAEQISASDVWFESRQ